MVQIDFLDKIMPTFTRFINCSERKTLWSILLFQIALVALSWYFIGNLQSNNECCTKLKRDYVFASPYINVPDNCNWWTPFLFRLNRYSMYLASIFLFYVVAHFYIPKFHLLMYVFIYQGLMFNACRAHEQNNIFYRDAPILLLLILAVLYLEKEPFRDLELISKWIEIDKKNDERLFALADIDAQYWIDVIFKIRQCDDIASVKNIIKQVDNDIEQQESIHQLLNEPILHEPEKKNISIYLLAFIRMTAFLLVIFSIWNHVLLFYRYFYHPFHQEKAIQIS